MKNKPFNTIECGSSLEETPEGMYWSIYNQEIIDSALSKLTKEQIEFIEEIEDNIDKSILFGTN